MELKRFKNYTNEECLRAVKKNGDNLQFITNQTEEICVEAVRQNGYALLFVKEQTEKICLEAVKKTRDASQYVEKYYESVAKLVDDIEYKNLKYDNNIIILNGIKYKRI